MPTVRELIERLEECATRVGDDKEVRLMTQQSWPFQCSIVGVTTSSDMINEEPSDLDDKPVAVFIVEGRQLGYGTKRAWDTAE